MRRLQLPFVHVFHSTVCLDWLDLRADFRCTIPNGESILLPIHTQICFKIVLVVVLVAVDRVNPLFYVCIRSAAVTPADEQRNNSIRFGSRKIRFHQRVCGRFVDVEVFLFTSFFFLFSVALHFTRTNDT